MQKAIIDLSKNGIIPVFHAKQGDTSRRVAITLLDNGLPYDTAADAVSVWYSGPSGEGNYSDGIDKDGSTLTILVNPNMTAASGRHTCAVMLSNESGRCTTWNFCVEVAYTPALGSEEVKAYFEAFEAGELAADIASVDARVSAIIASGTATEGNTELIDIRTGADGKVYPTAGDAVRGQIGEIKGDLNDVESYLGYPRNYFDGREFITTNTTNWTIVKDKTSVSFTHNNQFDTGTPTLTLNIPVGEYVFKATYTTSFAFYLYINNTYSRVIKDGDNLTIESGKTYMFEALSISSGATQTITDISITSANVSGVIQSMESNIDVIESAVNEISETVTITLSVEMESDTASTVATANGVESAGSGYHTVKFPVKGSDIAHVSVASTNWGNPYYIVCDSNNAVVDVSESSASSSTVSTLHNFDVTIPNNGSYLIVNYLPTQSVTPTAFVTRDVLIPKSVSHPFAGEKWVAIGDSLTEKNESASKNYVDLVCEKLYLSCVNMGVGGTGYMRGYDTNKAFYQRVANIPSDAAIITIFGSGNDLAFYNQLGTPSDTGTSTVCGCINTTLDYIANNFPTVPVVVIAPTIWKGQTPTENTPMTYYVQYLEEIAKKRSLHFLNLYSGGGLNPNNVAQLNTLFYHQTLDGNADGVHPNNAGHKIIASKIKNAIECALIAD